MKIISLNKKHFKYFLNLRISLFKELKEINSKEDIEELILSTKKYFFDNIEKNLLCWAIEVDNEIVSIASLNIFYRIPYAENLLGKEGYILNVYTLPNYRKKNMADTLIKVIIDYAKNNSIKKLWLNSSDEGKRIYLKNNFKEIENIMELYL
ncbi:GNAT family N-acetyltransferase [Cetobacterium somerae]|uniref:GNAT family N-acetyltransferase n=1 Tax=Cetobacterium somerae TaxID=188913 RepID=UPI002E7B0F5A|nr:GNAT family N-acetyltransferase [Cetobacterium somerae]WVJ03388.1 GNAT family N-acetyltransferase [Cetobacterium somerae]